MSISRLSNTMWTLRWRARRTAHRYFPKGPKVLVYHRITENGNRHLDLHVSPKHFSEQLEVLSKHYCVLDLEEFSDKGLKGVLPKNAVAITFDDGYADNLHNGLPLLRRHGLSATLFANSRWIGGNVEAWWDRIEHIIDMASNDQLKAIIGRPFPQARVSAEHVFSMLSRSILYSATRLQDEATTRWLRDIAAPEYARESRRFLTFDEARTCETSGYIRIEAHTANHSVLRNLSDCALLEEMTKDKAVLEQALNKEVRLLAYPYGTCRELDQRASEISRRAGFRYAYVNMRGAIARGTHPHEIPRVLVRNLDGEQFRTFLN